MVITRIVALALALSLTPVVAQAQGPATASLTGTIRDFKASHPDFENFLGDDRGIVKDVLGADGKPVYNGNPTTPTTTGAENFNQWWNNTAGVNLSAAHTITLNRTPSGTYVYDNQSFFPIDNQLWGNEGQGHNYWFTFQLSTSFVYQGGETFSFVGDDDVWVFINDRKVIDLGGVHGPESQSVNLDAVASSIGITPGGTYDLDFFFAERHTTGSSARIETSIAFSSCDDPSAITDNDGQDTDPTVGRVRGTSGDDFVCGGSGADRLEGLGGDDKLYGQAGGDTILGGAGNDTMDGGEATDTLEGGTGADVFVGGPGIHDLARYGKAVKVPLYVDMTGTNGDGDGAADEHDSIGDDIEKVQGGDAGDTIIGNAAHNGIWGGGGADAISGGLGADVLRGEAGYDTLTGDDDGTRGDSLVCDGDGGLAHAGTNDTTDGLCTAPS